MYKLAGKFVLLFLMVIGTFVMTDTSSFAENAPCPLKDAFSCCVYECTHDPGSGCGGSSSCCYNMCR